MTRDELLARYDLIEQVTEGDVETHHALHQSGAVVMVHFLRGSPTLNLAVAQAVQRLGAGEGSSGKVLHVHDVEGQPVVVTRFITDFVSLEHWLATLGLPVAEVDTGGDETLILQPGEGLGRPLDAGAVLQPPPPGPEQPPAPELPPSPVESPPPPQEPPPRGGGGEFTNMFRAAPPAETPPPVKPDQALTVETPRPPLDPPAPPADPPASVSQSPPEQPTPAPPPPPPSSGGGEFTQMFKAPLSQEPEDRPTVQRPPGGGVVPPGAVPPPTPPKPPVPPPPVPGSGEFTKLFRAAPKVEQDRNPWTDPARKPPEPADPPPPPQAAPPQAPSRTPNRPSAPADGPGEFTQFFKAPEAPKEPTGGTDEPLRYDQSGSVAGKADAPKPPDGAWGDALRSSTPSAKPPPPPPPGPTPEVPAGGGEFTQIFGRDTIPIPTAPPASPAAPGPGGQGQPPSPPPPPASAVPPPTPSPPRSSPLPGGLPTPRKPRLPGPEALLRGGGVRTPTPRMPVAPRPRQLGQMALRAAQAAPVGGGAADSAPAEGAPAGGETKPGKGTRALAVGIGVVLVLSLVLTLFFALWDFSEPTAETDATAQPAAEAEAQPPDTVG